MRQKLPILSLFAVAVLVAAAAPAGARKGCKPSSGWFEGVEGPLRRVTDAATEENPVVVEFSHGPAVGALIARQLADIKYFPIQVLTKKGRPGLHVRIEWGTPSVDEIDLFLQTNDGEYVAADDGTNVPLPLKDEDYPKVAGLSGMGYEYIPGYAVTNCAGFVVQSEALRSAGRDVTLKLWLGKANLS